MKSLLGGSKKSKTTVSGNGANHHQQPPPPPSKSSSAYSSSSPAYSAASPSGAPQLPSSPTPEPFQYTSLYARFATGGESGAAAISGPKSAPLESTANSGFGATARPSVTSGLGAGGASRSSSLLADAQRPTSSSHTRSSSRDTGGVAPGTPGQPIKLRGGKRPKVDDPAPTTSSSGTPRLQTKGSPGFSDSMGTTGLLDGDRAKSPAPPPPPSKSPPPPTPVDKGAMTNGSSRRPLFDSVQAQRSPTQQRSPTSPSGSSPTITATPGSSSKPSSSSRTREASPEKEKKTRSGSPTKPTSPTSPTKHRAESPTKHRSDKPRSGSPPKQHRTDSPTKTRSPSPPTKHRSPSPPTKHRSESPTKKTRSSSKPPSSPKYDGMPNGYDPSSPSAYYNQQGGSGSSLANKSPTSPNPPRSSSMMTPRTTSSASSAVTAPSRSASTMTSSRTTTNTSVSSHPPVSGSNLGDKQPSRQPSIRLLPVPPATGPVSASTERASPLVDSPSSSSQGHGQGSGSSMQNHNHASVQNHNNLHPSASASASGSPNGGGSLTPGASEDSEVEYAPPRRISQKQKKRGSVSSHTTTTTTTTQPQQEVNKRPSSELRPLPVPGGSARSSGEEPTRASMDSTTQQQQPRSSSERLVAQHSQLQRVNSGSRPERSASLRNAVGRTGSVRGPRPKPGQQPDRTESNFYGGQGGQGGQGGGSSLTPPTLSTTGVNGGVLDKAEVASPLSGGGGGGSSPGSLSAGGANPPLRTSTSSGSLRPLPEPPAKGTTSASSSADGHGPSAPQQQQQQRSSALPTPVPVPLPQPLTKAPLPPPQNPQEYLARQRQRQLEQEQEKKKSEAQEYLLQQKAQLMALQQQYQRAPPGASPSSPVNGPGVGGAGVGAGMGAGAPPESKRSSKDMKRASQDMKRAQAAAAAAGSGAGAGPIPPEYQRAPATSPYGGGPTPPAPGMMKPSSSAIRQHAMSMPLAPKNEELAAASARMSAAFGGPGGVGPGGVVGLGGGFPGGPSPHHASAAVLHAQRMAAYENRLAFPGGSEAQQQPQEPVYDGPPYPLVRHLAHPTLLAGLVMYLSFTEWTKIPRLCSGVRRMLDEKRELREIVLERYLKTVGYTRWTWHDRNEPIALSIRDVNAYMRGVSMPTHRYAEHAEQFLQSGEQGKTDITRTLAASCRAYSKILLRLRAQAEAERSVLLINSLTPGQVLDAKRAQINGGRGSSMGPGSYHGTGGGGSQPGSRPPSRGSNHGPTRMPLSPNPVMNAASPPGMTFKSPIYRLGHAPLLRVFVPSPNGAWLSDESVLACEKELKRAGVLELMQPGDVVWDTAVGEEGNMGRLIWDGNYLIDLDYTYSYSGEVPKYLHSFNFPPSYFHKVIRSTGNPIMQLDISPWSREIAGNLQLLQDKIQTETPQGGRHTVVRWVHRTRFLVRAATIIPDTEGLTVDPAWEGVMVLEVEGTNEGLADLKSRCGIAEHPHMPAGKPRQEMSGRVYRLLRERSRPGEIWIRAVTEKERLL